MMNKEQAIAYSESKEWEKLSLRERAVMCLEQRLLCMPFRVMHEAIEKSLGRPFFTHEMGALDWRANAMRELNGEREAPTFDDIVAMIPAEKLMLVQPERRIVAAFADGPRRRASDAYPTLTDSDHV